MKNTIKQSMPIKQRRPSDIKSQLRRFLINGGIATASHYTVFLIITYSLDEDNFLHRIGIAYAFATAMGYLTGLIISYTGNRFFVFQHSFGEKKTAQRYLVTYGLGLALNFTLMKILADNLGYDKTLAFILIVGTIAIANFFINRYWVFGHQRYK